MAISQKCAAAKMGDRDFAAEERIYDTMIRTQAMQSQIAL